MAWKSPSRRFGIPAQRRCHLTVFTSADRLSDGHELEAGVTAIVGDEEVARFICRPPLINKLEDIDLNPEG
jgi:hypothetical protein